MPQQSSAENKTISTAWQQSGLDRDPTQPQAEIESLEIDFDRLEEIFWRVLGDPIGRRGFTEELSTIIRIQRHKIELPITDEQKEVIRANIRKLAELRGAVNLLSEDLVVGAKEFIEQNPSPSFVDLALFVQSQLEVSRQTGTPETKGRTKGLSGLKDRAKALWAKYDHKLRLSVNANERAAEVAKLDGDQDEAASEVSDEGIDRPLNDLMSFRLRKKLETPFRYLGLSSPGAIISSLRKAEGKGLEKISIENYKSLTILAGVIVENSSGDYQLPDSINLSGEQRKVIGDIQYRYQKDADSTFFRQLAAWLFVNRQHFLRAGLIMKTNWNVDFDNTPSDNDGLGTSASEKKGSNLEEKLDMSPIVPPTTDDDDTQPIAAIPVEADLNSTLMGAPIDEDTGQSRTPVEDELGSDDPHNSFVQEELGLDEAKRNLVTLLQQALNEVAEQSGDTVRLKVGRDHVGDKLRIDRVVGVLDSLFAIKDPQELSDKIKILESTIAANYMQRLVECLGDANYADYHDRIRELIKKVKNP